MKSYLVAYGLGEPNRDETALHEAIKALASDCWRHLGNVWLISTATTAVTIRDRLRQHLEPDDELLVISLGANWATHNMPADNTDWLRMKLIPEAEAVFGASMLLAAAEPISAVPSTPLNGRPVTGASAGNSTAA